MNTTFIFGRSSRLIVMISLLLCGLVFGASASTFGAEENEELKRNLCGGANLSLSSGGNAQDGFNRSCTNPNDGTGDPANDIDSRVQAIVDIISVIVGIVAVFMILIGGLRFITSGGDSGRVGSAKNTILYAIVGLIVVALAQVIVRFVIAKTAL